MHVSLVPVIGVVGEQKTKPTQHSVQVCAHTCAHNHTYMYWCASSVVGEQETKPTQHSVQFRSVLAAFLSCYDMGALHPPILPIPYP